MEKRYFTKTGLVIGALTACALLASCNRSTNSLASNDPQRLPSAPVEDVLSAGVLPSPAASSQEQNIPKQIEAPTAPDVNDYSKPDNLSTASIPREDSSRPVTREGVSGTWSINSDNENCRLVLAFTKWSGGYRARSLKCSSKELAAVSAWDVKGKQVVLLDANGNTLARLYNSGGSRYDGASNSGKAISLTR